MMISLTFYQCKKLMAFGTSLDGTIKTLGTGISVLTFPFYLSPPSQLIIIIIINYFASLVNSEF